MKNWIKCLLAPGAAALLPACSGIAEDSSDAPSSLIRSNASTEAQYPSRDSMPPALFERMINSPRFTTKKVGHEDLAWNVPVLSVAFENGPPEVHALVEEAAQDWTDLGGRIQFSFRNNDGSFRTWSSSDTSPSAAIRISFRTDKDFGGYWSYAGTLAANAPSSEPTMNYGGFLSDLKKYYGGSNRQEWLKSYERGTILHEFGHALGLAHEHYHPDCQNDMNADAIVKRKMDIEGRSEPETRYNMIYKDYLAYLYANNEITQNPVVSGRIDRKSIMLYEEVTDVHGSVAAFYKSGWNSPCIPDFPSGVASQLSDGDKDYFLQVYGN